MLLQFLYILSRLELVQKRLAGGVCAVLIIIRTALEDRTLQAELTGYQEYARQVRYRLLPGIW